jgi:ketosteroid isomerase-like protein
MTPEADVALTDLALRVRAALEAADPAAFRDLLDPDVTWGAPGARRPSCSNRDQVLAWYEKGRAAGTRARVSDVTVVGDRLLVSLVVGGSPAAEERGGAALRWQVLSVRHGRIVDIVGFDDRMDALAHAGVPSA